MTIKVQKASKQKTSKQRHFKTSRSQAFQCISIDWTVSFTEFSASVHSHLWQQLITLTKLYFVLFHWALIFNAAKPFPWSFYIIAEFHCCCFNYKTTINGWDAAAHFKRSPVICLTVSWMTVKVLICFPSLCSSIHI